MNPFQVLAAVAAAWERLGPYLTRLAAEPGARLAAALEGLRAAGGEGERRGHAETAARLVLGCLPPEEAGRLGVGEGARYSQSAREVTVHGFRATDLAVLLVDGSPMVGPVLGPVRERLLAHPVLDDADVRLRGGDPTAPDLIRLPGTGGRAVLPRFQFRDGALPWRVVLEVNALLEAGRDPWGAADWWLSANAWLRTEPAALLGADRDAELVSAARTLLDGE
ncbi:hypothetical protein [Streptomyces achromogenes]|uniref:hypothetical protein n=1 Tax=Streptomyces achromogenes TaxID=67255 RepID=UPI0004C559EA|nr:hypothetical protein [Streptomyces achromogenes]